VCSASLLSTWIVLASLGAPGEWSCPAVPDIAELPHPRIAATPAELDRLRAAYRGDNRPAREAVAGTVREADAALEQPVEFPPRGGQHNQWYQCDACQLALKTIDATHHECPSCKKVYSGEPYDDVLFARTHHRNLAAMRSAAWAFALTGDERYARFAADVLLGYAARYREYPYHSASRSGGSWHVRSGGHLFEQTLTEAGAMASYIAPAYDLVCTSGVLSKEESQTIRDGLLRPMLENIAKNRAGKSNWQTWHNAAMLNAGAVLGSKEWVERAIADPGNGFVHQMQVSVSEDGMWYENSWGYHFYTLRALTEIVESARRLGVDLWGHPRLKRMFTVPVDYVMPDGHLPRFGDDVSTSVGRVARSLEFAFHAYRDPAMVPWLPNSPTWDSVMLGRAVGEEPEPPAAESKLFPAAGHAVLRTGGPKGLVSVMTFGPYGGFHGHFDKLSFVLYGCGEELGVDPGRARSQAYRLPIHREWYKATLAHNTVVVDRKSQAPASGRLLHFDADAGRALVVAQCSGAYEGVVHTRLLLQTPGYLLVFDDLKADAEHRFDWFYHSRGKLAQCDAAKQPGAGAEDEFRGMKYVENGRAGTTDGAVRVAFASEGVTTALTLDAAPKTDVLVGDGVGASVLDRVPLVRVTRRGRGTRFAAVLEPLSGDALPEVRAVAWHETDRRIEIDVVGRERRDTISADAAWSRLDFRSTATTEQ